MREEARREMSECPDCGSDENSCDCAIRHTSFEGLEEISKITMLEVALSETLMPRLNEMIERVNLLTNILIRLKEVK